LGRREERVGWAGGLKGRGEGLRVLGFFPKPFSNFKLLKLHTSNINIMQPKQHTYIFILFNL
jgi:hypothetical protein